MATLSNIITPTNVLTDTNTATLTNKTIAFGSNTLTDVASTNTTQTLTNKTYANALFDGSITEDVYVLTGTALNPANGTIQTVTLSANTTFTDSLSAGQSMVLMIGGGATYTVTWPTITWTGSGGNVAPTLTASDVVVLWKVSTTLYGAYVGSNA